MAGCRSAGQKFCESGITRNRAWGKRDAVSGIGTHTLVHAIVLRLLQRSQQNAMRVGRSHTHGPWPWSCVHLILRRRPIPDNDPFHRDAEVDMETQTTRPTASPVQMIVRRLLCWWFGCSPDFEHMNLNFWDTNGGYHVPCERCGAADCSYADQVGDTRHNRLCDWFRGHLWRVRCLFITPKCDECGKDRRTCGCPPF